MLAKARANSFIRENRNNIFYRENYLKSDHWKFLREEKLRLNAQCEKCGSLRLLDVHHKDYKGLYDVKISDLQTLCRKCHDKEHKKIKTHKLKRKLKHLRKVFKKQQKVIKVNQKELEKLKKFLNGRRPTFSLVRDYIRNSPVCLNERNRQRQKNFDKKYDYEEKFMSNYVSIHY